MAQMLRALAICAPLWLAPVPAHAADPLLMLLLGFIQNRIETVMNERANAPRTTSVPSAPVFTPIPLVRHDPKTSPPEASELRALVDSSFTYLSRAQRDELVNGLEKTLADPVNAPHRTAILNQFIGVANQVRHAHDTLDRLTPDEKRFVATQFTRNFRQLSADQQQALVEQLRMRALPVPSDLTDMMLAELAAAR